MKCVIINREDPQISEYDRFVRNHKNGHFLQAPEWAEVKPLWQWSAIVVRDNSGTMTGAMSVLSRSLPMGFSIAYVPRGPVCDRNDKGVIHALTQGLQDFARWKRCLLTYIDPDEPESNTAFCNIMSKLGYHQRHSNAFVGIQPYSVFRMPLYNRDEEELLASFAQKTRYNIRLSLRKGVKIQSFPGDGEICEDVLDNFALLMQETGKRDRFFVRNREYFSHLLSALGRDAVLYMAYLDGVPIAGSIAIYYGDKGWYLYGASANAHRDSMPNYLLQWTMIQEARNRQCRLYDFRGVPGTGKPDDPLYGLYRFKKGFGGIHTRFAGLFIFYHKPVLGRLFDYGKTFLRRLYNIKQAISAKLGRAQKDS